jgi:predicted acyl esterase
MIAMRDGVRLAADIHDVEHASVVVLAVLLDRDERAQQPP